jgi:hypothetical protein
MVTFRDARSVLLALTLVSVVATATAARFPDTVQRTFVVEGAPARELAALFGIAEAAETSLKLPVLDTGGMSSERNYGGLASNTIRFARQDDGLRVVIGDRWHDNETGSGKPVPKYSFTSPYIDPRLTASNGWTLLLRYLDVTMPASQAHGTVVARKHLNEDAAPFLSVLVSLIYDYVEERWVYRATLGLDDRKPGVRAAVSAMHEALMRQLKRDGRY